MIERTNKARNRENEQQPTLSANEQSIAKQAATDSKSPTNCTQRAPVTRRKRNSREVSRELKHLAANPGGFDLEVDANRVDWVLIELILAEAPQQRRLASTCRTRERDNTGIEHEA